MIRSYLRWCRRPIGSHGCIVKCIEVCTCLPEDIVDIGLRYQLAPIFCFVGHLQDFGKVTIFSTRLILWETSCCSCCFEIEFAERSTSHFWHSPILVK